MRPITLIRLLCAIIVLSFLACTLIIAKRAFFQDDAQSAPANKLEALIPEKQASDEVVAALVAKLEVENLPDVTPGERAFEAARELLKKGDYLAAEEKLKYVNIYYPTAVSAHEARRILGEMNMDRLLLGQDFSEIKDYKVKSGDSFFQIVRENQTNLDMLMYINSLTSLDRLYPGDTFKVMTLNFRLVIDLRRLELSVWDGARYVKGYEIKAETLPNGSAARETVVTAIEARFNERRVRLPSKEYHQAEKIIALKSPQAEIRAYTGRVDEGIVGIYLDKVDLEELVLLLRTGNSVEIRY